MRIGEKVKVGSKLCKIVDVVHYPSTFEDGYSVNVFVKVIKNSLNLGGRGLYSHVLRKENNNILDQTEEI